MKKRMWWQLLRLLPLGLMVFLLGFLLLQGTDWNADAIVKAMPQNTGAAAGILLLLFVLKSLAITFPIAALWVVSGLLFPLPLAFAVNTAGMLLGLSLPFWIGRFSGTETMERLMGKYPKMQRAVKLYRGRELFFSYILRYLPIPMDIASMLAGALSIPYGKFLLGGFLGLLPQLVAHTVFGMAVFQPASPAFWGSLLGMLLIGGVSLLLYWRELKKQGGEG